MASKDDIVLYSVGYSKKGEPTTIKHEELWGHERHIARETAKILSQKHKCDITITYTPKTILETVSYKEKK